MDTELRMKFSKQSLTGFIERRSRRRHPNLFGLPYGYSVINVHSTVQRTVSGDKGIRTLDPLLARQVLSQLSYTPIIPGIHLCSHIVTNVVFSAECVLTVVFGMGTGVTHNRINTR